METRIIEIELKDTELDCLRTAPHRLHKLSNVHPSTWGGIVWGLVRAGYLYEEAQFVGRDQFEDYSLYDLTPRGLTAIGGKRFAATDLDLAGIVWPPAAPPEMPPGVPEPKPQRRSLGDRLCAAWLALID